MELVFESFTELAQKVVNALNRRQLTPETGLLVRFGAGDQLDLFTLGRLLSLSHHLTEQRKIPVSFACKDDQAERLHALGFPRYCRKRGLKWIPSSHEGATPGPGAMRARGSQALLDGKKYWQCLVPLTVLGFEPPPASEEECIASVSEACSRLARDAASRLRELGLDPRRMHAELSLLFFRVARELLSNAATHGRRPPEEVEEGRGSSVVFALTLSRENEPGARAHRLGSPIPQGHDKYELLVMDLGRGVARTVVDTLSPGGARLLDADYFTLSPFAERFAITRAKEEALLQNLFRGDLVIRKGRKSDGLHDLGRTVSWFGGLLDYYTGRTELQLTSVGLGDLTCRPRREPSAPANYLPGVVASAVLASHHVKLASHGTLEDPETAAGEPRPCRIRSFRNVPEGFFGRTPAARVNRKSEMDVEQVATEYERAAEDAGAPVIWEIDLKVSDNLDIDYLDHFIQELCKRQSRGSGRKPPLLPRLVFTNVPRDVVHGLKLHNCDSFLRLSDAWCLMLDEADEPHFLGLPRASRTSFDIEDAFQLVLRAGSATRSSLAKRLRLEPALAHLDRLLDGGPGALFEARREGDDTVFTAAGLAGALQERRAGHLERLQEVRVYEDRKAAFRLANGTFVDSIYDFCLFWSDHDVLLDSAKLFLSKHRFPLVDGLIAFMNNGDRFASALQRLTGISALKIVDPHEHRAWGDFVLRDYVVVVDALYDGDEEGGYVSDLLQKLHGKDEEGEEGGRKTTEPRRYVAEIIAFCDFRSVQGDLHVMINGNRHEKIPVRSVVVSEVSAIPFPRRISPRKGLRLLRNHTNYVLPKPHPAPAGREGAGSAEEGERGPRPFSVWRSARSTEMTTEFWQNVSAVRLLDLEPMERETRDLLFYEYTERLVQNPRTRRIVTQFVSNYVRGRLGSDVDVILHPGHPIGAFVAQLIAAQLNRRPLILPVTQPRYGGPIEFSPEDYVYFRAETERVRAERGRPLRSVVLDDAVHTGRSLFAMLGITAHLGLPLPHVFVLVNRLPTEVSEAVRRSCESFTFLYRLNMPMAGATPDKRLTRENAEVLQKSNSYFAHYWGSILDHDPGSGEPLGHLRALCTNPSWNAPTLNGGELEIQGRHAGDTYKVRQVIEQLLLHPDASILDFETRLAVACNFLEQLVTENAFWATLFALARHNLDAPESASQSTRLVSALLYILAFSRHIHPYRTYVRFESLCTVIIRRCVATRERWVEHYTLVTECLMALGIAGSERLWEISATVLNPVIDQAMNDLSHDGRSLDIDEMDAREAARRIVAAYAWSLQLLVLHKDGAGSFAGSDTLRRLDRLRAHTHGDETHLLLIDAFEPVVEDSPALRRRLRIHERPDAERFLREIESDASEADDEGTVKSYLAKAPGYACTLKTVMRITGADTVLLYMRTREDQEYYLRAVETRRNRPEDFLKARDLSSNALPAPWRERMKEQLFFHATGDLEALDVFQKNLTHTWCLGGAIYDPGDIRHYVILGYTGACPEEDELSTVYYYWLRCEGVLREILPTIHGRFLQSSSAWNALVKSVRPIHPILPVGSDDSPVFRRRADLRLAMASVNIGDFVRRAVGMSLVPVRSLYDIRELVSDTILAMRRLLVEEKKRNPERTFLLDNLHPWPHARAPKRRPREESAPREKPAPGLYVPLQHERDIYCAFHLPVLEFITYESLCNTLSYYRTAESISIQVEFRVGKTVEQIERIFVELTIENDVYQDPVVDAGDEAEATVQTERKPTGVLACEMAAEAVGGEFVSEPLPGGRRRTFTRLPAYRVPDRLQKRLSDYLRSM